MSYFLFCLTPAFNSCCLEKMGAVLEFLVYSKQGGMKQTGLPKAWRSAKSYLYRRMQLTAQHKRLRVFEMEFCSADQYSVCPSGVWLSWSH